MRILEWLVGLLSGKPHFYIGGRENPYMLRWFLIPRNGWLNIYLHKFMRDDDDRAMHDHPWWFVSVMLRGCYREDRYVELRGNGFVSPYIDSSVRRWLSIAIRRATDRHRVTLRKDTSGRPVPCWTLVVTGPRVREWGFWCPQGFVHWKDFVASDDEGNTGKGCG